MFEVEIMGSPILVHGPRPFKTGSTGYHGQGKAIDPETGDRYQVNILMTLIGSKPIAASAPTTQPAVKANRAIAQASANLPVDPPSPEMVEANRRKAAAKMLFVGTKLEAKPAQAGKGKVQA